MTDITLDNLLEAQAGLVGIAERTPLIPVPIAESLDSRLKAEYLQPIGAFKIRGAWTALRRLDPGRRDAGVVTSSSGNHGLGIAFAARRLGMRAVVVMPESAAQVKVDGVRRLGAEVVLAGMTRGPEQTVAAQRLVDESGLTMIPPFDHPDVIAGQGTCGLEILQDWPEVETIVAPVGGGGLLAGICCAVRAAAPHVEVIAAEPSAIRKLSAAIAAGSPRTIQGGSSLADGLLTMSIGHLTWPLIRETVRTVVPITDDEIRESVRWLATRQIRVEPSGAVAIAAVRHHRGDMTGTTRMALVSTGGNVDSLRYQELVA